RACAAAADSAIRTTGTMVHGVPRSRPRACATSTGRSAHSRRKFLYGRHGLVERRAMLLDVRCGLAAVPLEAHRTILTCVVSPVRLTLPFSGAACATADAASQKASLSTGSVLVFRPHGRQ